MSKRKRLLTHSVPALWRILTIFESAIKICAVNKMTQHMKDKTFNSLSFTRKKVSL